MKAYYITEPKLFFRDGDCIDPRIGLLNFKPNGLTDQNKNIKIALLSDNKTKQYTKDFFKSLEFLIQGREDSESNIRSIDFPGVYEDSNLGFQFSLEDDLIPSIDLNEMNSILNAENSWSAIEMYTTIIDQRFRDLLDLGLQEMPLVIIPIPLELMKKCRDRGVKDNRIRLWGRRYWDLMNYLNRSQEGRPPLFDFHNYIKTLGFKYHIKTQVLRFDTLEFNADQDYDPATVAWNFAVSLYYKSSETPWKVVDLNPETIHVGISFYLDISPAEEVIKQAALAQIYMRNADSQIIRGLKIPVESEEDAKKTNLTQDQAHYILSEAIRLYSQYHNHSKPMRVVVHKTSPYDDYELEGFKTAANGIEIQDFIHIQRFYSFKALPSGQWPMCRGSVFETLKENKPVLDIYTTGFIPALSTYPGSQVPDPIRTICVDCASPPRRIATDILELTKLDWNSTDFAKREPVTISVADKVGKILGEINGREIEPLTAYAYYM